MWQLVALLFDLCYVFGQWAWEPSVWGVWGSGVWWALVVVGVCGSWLEWGALCGCVAHWGRRGCLVQSSCIEGLAICWVIAFGIWLDGCSGWVGLVGRSNVGKRACLQACTTMITHAFVRTFVNTCTYRIHFGSSGSNA